LSLCLSITDNWRAVAGHGSVSTLAHALEAELLISLRVGIVSTDARLHSGYVSRQNILTRLSFRVRQQPCRSLSNSVDLDSTYACCSGIPTSRVVERKLRSAGPRDLNQWALQLTTPFSTRTCLRFFAGAPDRALAGNSLRAWQALGKALRRRTADFGPLRPEPILQVDAAYQKIHALLGRVVSLGSCHARCSVHLRLAAPTISHAT